MTYEQIAQIVTQGQIPTMKDLMTAIDHQVVRAATVMASKAKHLGNLRAAPYHPFPLPDDEQARVGRRAALYNREFERLTQLHLWRAQITHLSPLSQTSRKC